MNRTAVVFDLDGTLIDSVPDIRNAANAAVAGMGIDLFSVAEIRSFVGAGAPILIERMLAARDKPQSLKDEIYPRFLDAYKDAHNATVLYPHVRETLTALRDAGYALGICTNKPDIPTRAVLDHFDLTSMFEVIIGGDTFPKRKPDPMPLFAAYDPLEAAQRIYVGDSEVDADTAVAANVPFLLYTEGYRKTPVAEMPHTVAFDDYRLLPEIIAGL